MRPTILNRNGITTRKASSIGFIATYENPLYDSSEEPRMVDLPITNISVDGCGVSTYNASVGVQDGARTHITLVDYSTSRCLINVEHLWAATIREGYGWCGTMDTLVKVVGNPEFLNYELPQ